MSFFGPRPPGSSASSLISFYEGTGRDHRGRRLSEILRWDASRLESSHDYIQTMFPLPEASGVNWDAPVINRQVFDAFRSRVELRGHLRDSFQKILWFYGFKLVYEDGEAKVGLPFRFGHTELTVYRLAKAPIMASIPETGTTDSTITISESRELSAAFVFSVSKMKPRLFGLPLRAPRRGSILDHVSSGDELRRGL